MTAHVTVTNPAIRQVLVNAFLTWKLPADFRPDGGISYTRPNYAPEVDATPYGTNLLDATQAGQLIDHLIASLSDSPLQTALDEILGEAPAKEPKDYPSVGFDGRSIRSHDDESANELVAEAFQEGVDRGYWEACAAFEALLKTGSAS